jgi:integrase/recombinase XerC
MKEIKKEIKTFLEYLQKQKNYSKHTVSSYQGDLKQFGRFLFSEMKTGQLNLIDRLLLRNYLVFLNKKGNDFSSIKRKLSSLRSFFRFLKKTKKIKINPVISLDFPKVKKKLPEFLSIKQMQDLLESKEKETVWELRDKAVLEVLYSTGIRLSELAYLQFSSIDFNNQTIRVLGKRNKERIIPIGAKALESVKAYLEQRNSIPQASDCKYIFVNKNGAFLTPRSIERIVKKYASQIAPEKKVSPHTLRHTFATHLLDEGADLMAVKELLGHESLSTTQIYTHITIDKLKKVYDKAHPRSGK